MSNKVSFVYIAQDKYSRIAKQVRRVTEQTRQKFKGMGSEIAKTSRKITEQTRKINKLRKSATDFGKSLSTKVTLPLTALGGAALVQSAKFENLDVAFETLIGNAAEAEKTVKSLINFTATTPFQMEEVANAGRQLLAFGVESDKVTGVLRQLGDLAAGTGKPLSEFSLIYGKILAKGKVTGEEMLQLAEKGISLQTILAEKHGVSSAQISEAVSKGAVTFDVFREAIEGVTSKGGKFFNLTKKQSQTLGGLASTMKDAVVIAFKEFGDILVKQFKLKEVVASLITKVNSLVQSLVKFSKENPKITKMVLIFGALLAAIGPVIVIGAQLASGFAVMALAAGSFGIALSPILITLGAIALAVGVAVAAFVFLEENWTTIGGTINQMVINVQETWKGLSMTIGGTIHHMGLIIDGIVSKIAGFKDEIADFATGKVAEIAEFFGFGGDVDVSQKSRTDINVNLRSPEGAVESVKSKTTGKVSGQNVGVNMVTQG